MNVPLQTYSFKNVTLQIDGRTITDYHEGDDVIVAARRNDSASDVIGADGQMALAIHADLSGTIKFKIKQTSPDAFFLYGLVNTMQAGRVANVAEATVKDARRADVATGAVGYVLKPADMTRGKGINLQEWTIVFQSLIIATDEVSGPLAIAASMSGL